MTISIGRIRKRDELPPLERAVSDTLDEWLSRLHGTFTSWSGPVEFLEWLKERGYVVRKEEEVTRLEAAIRAVPEWIYRGGDHPHECVFCEAQDYPMDEGKHTDDCIRNML